VVGLLQARDDNGQGIGEVDHAYLVARRHDAPTGRSPSRITPAIISFSPGSSTPACSASTTSVRISSSLTRPSFAPRWPSSQSSALPEAIEQPDQRQRDLRHHIHGGRDLTAMDSGSRSAICFGTSSPTISEA
jgi:hypothetical protein